MTSCKTISTKAAISVMSVRRLLRRQKAKTTKARSLWRLGRLAISTTDQALSSGVPRSTIELSNAASLLKSSLLRHIHSSNAGQSWQFYVSVASGRNNVGSADRSRQDGIGFCFMICQTFDAFYASRIHRESMQQSYSEPVALG